MVRPFRLLILFQLAAVGPLAAQETKPSPAPAAKATEKSPESAVALKAEPATAKSGNSSAEVKAAPDGAPPPAAAAAEDPIAPVRPPLRQRSTSMDALFRLVPIGRTHEGVHYPVMDGNLISALVDSERMTRIDENSLRFENAVIDQRGTDPMTFRLVSAVYNRATDQLMSTQPAVIETKSYRIEGDAMNYDRKGNVSRMDGRVRMTIFDLDDAEKTETKEPKKAPAQPNPAPPSPATPPKPQP